MAGVIYQVTCIPTGLLYIGQAKNNKTKNGTEYCYGATGRWNDHVSSAKSRNTPLCKAIKEFGRSQFTVKILEEAPLDELDEREASWITRLNCIHPNGYNVASHSRNRHREISNLHVFYTGRVSSAIIHPIRKKGELRMVYVYLSLHSGDNERIAFGQKKTTTYEESMKEAKTFLDHLECPYRISSDYSDEISERYQTKKDELKNKIITSIRITSASNLIAVYIGTADMKFKKDHIRICFGGKKINKQDAYATALQFVNQLDVYDENIIHDSIKSQQQATAI